jgi:HK97 family phage prohead protease
MQREVRFNIGHLSVQQRAKRSGSAATTTVSGYAAVFNSMSRDLGFREVIHPQAFRSCDMSECLALWMHSQEHLPLGRQSAGNLRLSTDRLGLRFEADLDPQVTFHNDLIRLVQSGTIDQCSFAFSVAPGGDIWFPADGYTGPGAEDLDPSDEDVRLVTDISTLYDVSLVTTGAYASTSCEVQS